MVGWTFSEITGISIINSRALGIQQPRALTSAELFYILYLKKYRPSAAINLELNTTYIYNGVDWWRA